MRRFNANAARPYRTKTGEEKNRYVILGRAVEFDDGNISIEIDTLPQGDWWNGKIMLYPQEARDENAPKKQRAPEKQSNNEVPDFADEIPF